MNRRWTTALLALAGSVGVIALVAAVMYPEAVTDAGTIRSTLAIALWGCTYLVVGGFLAWRRPTLTIPWILVALGVDVCASALAQAAGIARPELAARFPAVGVACFVVFGCLAGLLAHLYPTGRPPTPRWRWVVWLLVISTAVESFGQLAGVDAATAALPLKVAALVAGIGYAVGLISAVPSVAIRMHRASGVERAQLKWFFLGLIGGVVGWFLTGALAAVGVALAALLPIVAIVIALLRYRLYDIDRVISRTASYVIVCGLLLALYAAIVVSAGRLLDTKSPIVVAAATLAAAATARPLYRRVRQAVDRRFNRRKYNAERTVAAFGERLKEQVDPEQLVVDLRQTLSQSLEPSLVQVTLVGDA